LFTFINEPIIRVSPKTLFKLETYRLLSDDEKWNKALEDGWRFDPSLNKFYK